jgi:copper(I)-binding protein
MITIGKNHMPLGRPLAAGLLALFATAARGAEPSVHVMDAWIREAPPGVTALAGYATLHNMTKGPVSIVKVESPAFATVEMHRTEIRDGMARMVEQKRLDVPAGGERKLSPGGDHLMLLNPRGPLKAGDAVEWTLVLDDGSRATVRATVRRDEGGARSEHRH